MCNWQFTVQLTLIENPSDVAAPHNKDC